MEGWGCSVGIRALFQSEKRLNFSINPRKLSILYRSFSNRNETLVGIEKKTKKKQTRDGGM